MRRVLDCNWCVLLSLVSIALLAVALVSADAQAAPVAHDAAQGGHGNTGDKGHAKDGNAGHHEAEQPNLLKRNLTADLAIWTVVVFVLLLFILRKLAWQPMLDGLQKREETIRRALEEAKEARDEAHRCHEQLQSELDKAHERVREILDAARKDAQHAHDELMAEARAEIQAERERLHREMNLACDQALQELWNQSAQLATLVSAKVIHRQLSPADHRALVDEALTELRQAGNGRQRSMASL